MTRIFSNGPRKDYVINPFRKLIASASHLHLAAPYFTHADPILAAVQSGKSVQLLVGLNSATSPDALKKIHGRQDLPRAGGPLPSGGGHLCQQADGLWQAVAAAA